MSWYDPRKDPAFLAWRDEQIAADLARGPAMPIGDVPELLEGRRQLGLALQLLENPEDPGALAGARAAARRALGLVPQPRPDSECAVERWRRRGWSREEPAALCTRRTCGRCVPLRAAERLAEAHQAGTGAVPSAPRAGADTRPAT
ncbi:hypothetical protein ACFXPX_04805 [Kitasatospora sp. NPDC059146]|uniref:hypothetical protein n=1 Tax=unclassified Kitasatospora TaxID=2633591 RepID=UPI0036C82FDE